ncbi:MAG: hypothetical protein COV29_03520 [Candidatus Yanofskybacteria bacterium CG10_big_fil_rev_8_21_14_0_10_36_16]|uniref:Uncharacterized protein n=1 Tax=Candidatus Yanofskybacteria bacterium CG10_big_fil_rev_8_21_14_0_10_36_16 TaxID=1975096 RepID=A0A2J0Q7E3_9BACT|nr:MAG: hypothetical protein COV29_03520 [Candidatus Yanofskybacteria bacterium CG10_big_fil_rev_8_21_14_0_10_36_16]
MNINKNNSGFIAITSAIVISALLMAIMFALSFRGFFGRFDILDSEYKERSAGLAEACAENAMLRLVQDINYVGDEIFSIGVDSCRVRPILTAGSEKKIETTASVQNAVTNIEVIVDDGDISVVSWQEVANF